MKEKKAKRERPVSIISAILFLILGAMNLYNALPFPISEYFVDSEFLVNNIIRIVLYAAVGISAVIASILLFMNKKSRLFSAFAISGMAINGFTVFKYILTLADVSFFKLPTVYFYEGYKMSYVGFHLASAAVRFAVYAVLLICILKNCGSSQKKLTGINTVSMLSGLLVPATIFANKIITYSVKLTKYFISELPVLFLYIEGFSILEILLEGAAIITLCLWLKRKNNIETAETDIETEEFEETDE